MSKPKVKHTKADVAKLIEKARSYIRQQNEQDHVDLNKQAEQAAFENTTAGKALKAAYEAALAVQSKAWRALQNAESKYDASAPVRAAEQRRNKMREKFDKDHRAKQQRLNALETKLLVSGPDEFMVRELAAMLYVPPAE